jgi:hypothetical protein
MPTTENDTYTSESETTAILADPETIRAIAEATDDYTSWTGCQFYGHRFSDNGHCTEYMDVAK